MVWVKVGVERSVAAPTSGSDHFSHRFWLYVMRVACAGEMLKMRVGQGGPIDPTLAGEQAE